MTIDTNNFKNDNKAFMDEALDQDITNPYSLTLSYDVYSEILEKYPLLVDNIVYRRMFETLFLKRCRRDSDSGLTIISNRMLARIEGKECQWKQNNYNGTKLLTRFRDNVLPSLKWSKWKWGEEGRARVITNLDIDNDLLDRMLHSPCSGKKEVYFHTGRDKTLQTQSHDYAIRLAQAVASEKLAYHNSDQQLIGDVINATPVAKLRRQVERYKGNAQARLNSIKGPIGHYRDKTDTKLAQQQLLKDIVTLPKPIYTVVDNSERLFGGGMTIIDRRLRKELLSGCIDVDLKSAYAAIASKLWNIPELYEYLDSGKDLWKSFIDFMGFDDIERDIAKDIVKQPFYACFFGMEADTIDWLVRKLMKESGINRCAPRFTKHPLMQIALLAREREIERATKEEGTYTPYGWLPANYDREVTTHLSHAISAYELKLITPVFGVIKNKGKYVTAMLYQWDGVTLDIKPSRQEEVFRAMECEVKRVADELDIPTTLERKQ